MEYHCTLSFSFVTLCLSCICSVIAVSPPVIPLPVVLPPGVTTNMGYLLTMPQTLQAGADEQFCLTMHGITEDQHITVSLFEPTTEVLATYNYTYVSGGSQCHRFKVPEQPGRYEVQLENATEVFAASEVEVQGKNLITFVQTDKPIYKPGQTVKFRILTMKRDLRSRVGEIDEVYIIDPNDFKVKQYRKVDSQGMASLQFQLIDQAKLGTWRIQVTVDGQKTTQSFKVEEYVLPRFEVSVQPPSYLLVTTEVIEGSVCAKYTYGKPVFGLLSLSVCARGYGSFSEPCARVVKEIDGCVDFSVNASEVFPGRYLHSISISFDASVTEGGTGVKVNSTVQGPRISYDPLKMTFSDNTNGYFKPGFPIQGMLKAEKPDGSPAAGERIMITARDYRNNVYLEKTFTADKQGQVHYSICQGVLENTTSLSLEAVAVDYKPDAYGSLPRWWRAYQPRAHGSIQQWFSPSLSYIQIPKVQRTLQCDEELSLNIPYTHSGTKPYIRFYYQVMARGRIVYAGQKQAPTLPVPPLSYLEAQLDRCLEIGERPTHAPPPPPVTSSPTNSSSSNSSEIAPPPEVPYLGEPEWAEEPVMAEMPTTLPRAPEPTRKPVAPEPPMEPPVEPPEEPLSEMYSLGDADSEEGSLRRKRSFIAPYDEKEEPVVRSEEISDQVSTVKLTIPVTTEMSPKFSLLVYYVRDDGETVADSMEFQVEPCFENEVKMQFVEKSVLPGTNTNIRLEAAPGSVCGIGVVDKSVNILGGDHQVTPDKVFEKLAQYSLSTRGSYSYFRSDRDYCEERMEKLREEEETEEDEEGEDEDETPYFSYFWYSSNYVDAVQAFQQMGMLVLTNLVLETRPCYRRPPVYYDAMPMAIGGGLPGPSETLETTNLGPPPVARESSGALDLRSYFPETWLWDIEMVGASGLLELRRKIPDTITNWVGNSMCLSERAGFGLSPVTSITTFQPFFLSFNLPYNAVRGERLPITVTVYNYLDKCLHMMLRVDGRKVFKVHNARAARDPFCLCAGKSHTKKFFITAKDIGKLPIFAQAEVVPGQCGNDVLMDTQYIGRTDAVQREILVKAEGVTQQYSHGIYICPKDGEVYASTFNLPLPSDIVSDSARGDVTVIGDIMGPALSNLDGLVRMPTGCGEQTMVGFTPNIYVLKYLTATGRLDEGTQDKAKSYMESGYQRELTYRHSDGSFSAFGEREGKPGSTWLTAFVVKSFAEARPYIFIDQQDLENSINYLKRTQSPEALKGCFFERGKVFSSYMQGGLGQKEEDNHAALTAYVLIALLQAGLDKEDSITGEAINCINREMQRNPEVDTYTLALAAYANTLYDPASPQTADLMKSLDQHAVDEGSVKHWKRKGEQPKPVNSWYYYTAPSAEVEMTSYALLAILKYYGNESVARAQPIAFWLSNQQSAFGGFSSTQDTVVGLNALSEFAALTYSDKGTDLRLAVASEKTGQTFTFSVTPDNSLQLQREQLDMAEGTMLTVTAEGSGCALVKANVHYNKMPSKLGIDDPKFSLTVKHHLYEHDINRCDRRTLHINFGVQNKEQFSAGMTILTVRMVTGWSVIPESLRELKSLFPILGIERHEWNEEEGLVNFYLDELDTRRRDLTLHVQQNRDLAVSHPKPAEVQIYQYYERDMTVIRSYNLKTRCGTKEEIPYDEPADGATPFPVQRRVDGPSSLNVGASTGRSASCPVCNLEKAPDNYAELVCSSTAVYKSHAGRNRKYSLKIKADLRPRKKLRDINKFANFRMDEGCVCPLLDPPMRTVLILTKRSNMQGSTLTLDGETYIFNLRKDRTLERKARKAQRRCRLPKP